MDLCVVFLMTVVGQAAAKLRKPSNPHFHWMSWTNMWQVKECLVGGILATSCLQIFENYLLNMWMFVWRGGAGLDNLYLCVNFNKVQLNHRYMMWGGVIWSYMTSLSGIIFRTISGPVLIILASNRHISYYWHFIQIETEK